MNLTLQKGTDPTTDQTIWLMLDEDYEVVMPIQQYLTFLTTTKSPNTVRSYGFDLKYWWEFLAHKCLDWREVNISDMEDFAYWLRVGDTKVVSMQPVEAIRSEKTVNHAITAVTNFYDYHIANKTVDFKQFERFYMPHGISRAGSKGLLTGIAKSKPVKQKLVKLKEKKKFPGCLKDEEVETLVDACNNIRDKLMILMLNGTGFRKGELLCLMHDDVGDYDQHYVRMVDRGDSHPEGERAKGQERTVPVIPELLKMYNDYLIHEYPETNWGYVFVNIWEGEIGYPMNSGTINTMFRRLSKKTGIHVYPHLFRHTYATRLLRANYAPERVKYLLGHRNIQTTLDVYSHVITEVNLLEITQQEEK